MKIGFVGAGNMGGAIAKRLISSKAIEPENMIIADLDESKTEVFKKMNVFIAKNAAEVASCSDVVILAVKPVAFDYVLKDISDYTKPLYISIAAGITIDYIKSFFKANVRVIRAMPNTPALIGEGVTVVSSKHPATEDDEKLACKIFESVGIVERLNESYLNAVGSLSGSSPAYVYMMIEAMADAAVADGIPRHIAYKLAAQAVSGSAKTVLETGEHPARLKDAVCSPGGTTIRAVAELESGGFRSSLIKAMKECTKRSEELTK